MHRPPHLAFHWSRAGDIGRAAPHALRAARQAAALHAHREAIGQYELALAGAAAPEAEILVAIGDHHAALSECEAAVSAYRRARSLLRRAGDAARVAERQPADRHARTPIRSDAAKPSATPKRRWPDCRPATRSAGGPACCWRSSSAPRANIRRPKRRCAAPALTQPASSCSPDCGSTTSWAASGPSRATGPRWSAPRPAVLDEAADDSDDALALRHDAHAALGEMAFYRGQLERSIEHHRACLEIAERRGLLTDQVLARWSIGMRLYYLGRWASCAWRSPRSRRSGFAWMAEVAPHFELWLDGRWEEAERGLAPKLDAAERGT